MLFQKVLGMNLSGRALAQHMLGTRFILQLHKQNTAKRLILLDSAY